ncbi:hypothetical protein GPJ56_000194 [Histomonas meleagridis]|uniref:uncharacterized protein n=1 Tax=Histomonas meleagridis TaxID=135588 RepID=UPI00355999C4|nr:hypothetical protein GPJ56_000194 [Histomonas meleagridis]KAH0799681.1 hypothetical protein GO595_007402 [Histomonas meleagridis]
MLADISETLQDSNFDSMKMIKSIKDDIDHKLAAEFVFEYLQRHGMKNTIRCIELETNKKLSQKPVSNNIKKELNIDAKENLLSALCEDWLKNSEQYLQKNETQFRTQLEARLKDASQKKESPKASKKKPANDAKSPPKKSKRTGSIKKKRRSSTSNKQSPKGKSKSDELSSFDTPKDSNEKAQPSPASKPKEQSPKKTPSKEQDNTSALFDEFDEDFDLEEPKGQKQPSPKKPVASPPPQEKPSNSFEDIDFDDDFDEQPVKKVVESKAKPKLNEPDSFGDIDLDVDDLDEKPIKKVDNNKSTPKAEEHSSFIDLDLEDAKSPQATPKSTPKTKKEESSFGDIEIDFDDL